MIIVLLTYKKRNANQNISYVNYTLEKEKNQIGEKEEKEGT